MAINEFIDYSRVFHSLEIGFWRLDEAGLVKEANPYLLDLLGYSIDEIQGREVELLLCDKERGRLPLSPGAQELELLTRTGHPLWVAVESHPLYHGQGFAKGSMALIWDLRQRQKLQEALQESEERYQRLMNNVACGVVILQENRIVAATETSLPFFEVDSLAQLLGMDFFSFVYKHSFEDFQRILEQEQVDGQGFVRLVGSYGKETYCEATLTVIKWEQKASLQIVLKDVTQREHALQDLAVAQKQADAANQVKSQFLANMSHEIRTPLNSILGFAEILEQKAEQEGLAPAVRRQVTNIRQSGENLAEIIENILDLSKIEANLEPPKQDVINLRLLVQGMHHAFKSWLHQKELTLSSDIDPSLPETFVCDRVKLLHILKAIIDNAVKFSPQGGQITITVALEQGRILFAVADQGPGVAANMRDRIFVPFERSDASYSKSYQGLGLGLALTKELVNRLSGDINFYDNEQGGSTFVITLPIQSSAKESGLEETRGVSTQNAGGEEAGAVSQKGPPLSLKGGFTILVAEDNEINLEMVELLLEKSGQEIMSARNGEEAVELVAQKAPDLIFMDLHMPVMDGITASQKIRTELGREDIPILALTADLFAQDEMDAQKAGITDFIIKPLTKKKLEGVLSHYLHKEEKENDTPESDPLGELTESQREQLRQELLKLQEIPYYLTSKIHTQLKYLASLDCAQSYFWARKWEKMKQALFAKDHTSLQKQIQRLMERLAKDDSTFAD